MENVNKIQIRIDSIKTSAATITIPFGLDFFPVDNTELQETEFVEKEIEKAINPIFDEEKYPFYPTYIDTQINQILNAYNVEFKLGGTYALDFLGLTDDDITYRRNAFKKTYLRLNFYDSRDLKVQNLVARETIHLHFKDSWSTDEILNPQSTIPLSFETNYNNLIYRSLGGEGFQFYWYKHDLPKTLYIKPSLMNAKTGEVINLYSKSLGAFVLGPSDPSLSVSVVSGGYNYIQCDFYKDLTKRQQYYYTLNSDNLSEIYLTPSPPSIQDSINNKITIILYPY